MDYYAPRNAFDIVQDWTKLQGYTHPSDAHIQPQRDLNARYVTLENSSKRPIGIAITTYYCGGPLPELGFILRPGEIKHLGINTHGAPMQFCHLLDPKTHQPVGHPFPFRTDANSFVLRDGLQNWYVHNFYRPVYSAAK